MSGGCELDVANGNKGRPQCGTGVAEAIERLEELNRGLLGGGEFMCSNSCGYHRCWY